MSAVEENVSIPLELSERDMSDLELIRNHAQSRGLEFAEGASDSAVMLSIIHSVANEIRDYSDIADDEYRDFHESRRAHRRLRVDG